MINEPKTPYHAPIDDSDLDIPPLDLDASATSESDAAGVGAESFKVSRKDHYAVPGLKALLSKKVFEEGYDEAP
jgi:hypothetical protein